MHIHRLEKIWLTFGLIMLLVFLLLTGVAAFEFGVSPPSSMTDTDPESMSMNMNSDMKHGKVDPAKLQTTAPALCNP